MRERTILYPHGFHELDFPNLSGVSTPAEKGKGRSSCPLRPLSGNQSAVQQSLPPGFALYGLGSAPGINCLQVTVQSSSGYHWRTSSRPPAGSVRVRCPHSSSVGSELGQRNGVSLTGPINFQQFWLRRETNWSFLESSMWWLHGCLTPHLARNPCVGPRVR